MEAGILIAAQYKLTAPPIPLKVEPGIICNWGSLLLSGSQWK
jgi:hypothetical protein